MITGYCDLTSWNLIVRQPCKALIANQSRRLVIGRLVNRAGATGTELTGVDLSKIFGGKTKVLGAEGGKKMINAWLILNYWGYLPGLPSQVYAYDRTHFKPVFYPLHYGLSFVTAN